LPDPKADSFIVEVEAHLAGNQDQKLYRERLLERKTIGNLKSKIISTLSSLIRREKNTYFALK
jgi:hypothetical protein